MQDFIVCPESKVPVVETAVVVGGSCTGVFAAIRAARLGLKVVLIEKLNMLGGMAVSSFVNNWHSLYDTNEKKQIIGGLTAETIARLETMNGIEKVEADMEKLRRSLYRLNPWKLAFVLDEFVKENKIRLYLHTTYVKVISEERKISAVLINNVDGISAIKTRFLIDATGNGVIARDLGCPSYRADYLQPPTSCFLMQGKIKNDKYYEILAKHSAEFGFSDDWGWSCNVPGMNNITLRADRHVLGLLCDDAKELTEAEMEGRHIAKKFMDMLNKYTDGEELSITAFCSNLGVRETVHFKTRYCANADDLLKGKRFEAPIMNGSYRIDIHHPDDGGITFRELDGREIDIVGSGSKVTRSNWRERLGLTDPPATYYQLPFDVLVGEEYDNFIAVGRMVNSDIDAFGAVRVMVNLNQMGEAAGVAAYVCLNQNRSLQDVDGKVVTETLRSGGSLL